MRRNHFSAFPARQLGAALLIFMLFTFLVATSWVLGQGGAIGARNQLDRTTATAMAQAKEALIGRAATDNNRPGSLPCPDTNNDGGVPLLVGNHCPSYIGRLPWKYLRVGDLRDSAGERLWYALAPALRDDNSAQPINPQKPLELTLDGRPNVAAIIFSAGAPAANQSGRSSNAAADYLDEANNGNPNSAYVSGPPSPTFNDKALAVTRDDIFRTVNQRVLAEIRGPDDNASGAPTYGLRRYWAANSTFPWADSGSDGMGDIGTTNGHLPYNELMINPASLAWLGDNGWLPLITYQRLGPSLARLGIIGSSQTMDVIPCPASPCP